MKSIVISLTDLIKYKKYLFKSDISVHAQIEIYLFNLIFIAINAIMFAHQILYLLFCNVMKLLNKQVIIRLDIYLIPKLLLSEFLIFSVILIATFCRKKHLLKKYNINVSNIPLAALLSIADNNITKAKLQTYKLLGQKYPEYVKYSTHMKKHNKSTKDIKDSLVCVFILFPLIIAFMMLIYILFLKNVCYSSDINVQYIRFNIFILSAFMILVLAVHYYIAKNFSQSFLSAMQMQFEYIDYAKKYNIDWAVWHNKFKHILDFNIRREVKECLSNYPNSAKKHLEIPISIKQMMRLYTEAPTSIKQMRRIILFIILLGLIGIWLFGYHF